MASDAFSGRPTRPIISLTRIFRQEVGAERRQGSVELTDLCMIDGSVAGDVKERLILFVQMSTRNARGH